MDEDDEYEKAEIIRQYGYSFWAECEAEAKAFNEELARDIRRAEEREKAQAKYEKIRAENMAREAESRAMLAALQEQFEVLVAREKRQKEVHTKECLNAEPTEEAIVPILPLPEVHTEEPVEEMHDTEPMSTPLEVISPLIVTPPPPFYVKVIPDNLDQDSFMFKYGGLVKWHVKEEETDTSSHSPSYTESQRKIQVCEYGGERAKDDHSSAKRGYAKRTKSLYERKHTC